MRPTAGSRLDSVPAPPRRGASIAASLVAILLVAINLRPAITAVGPVMPLIGTGLGLGPASLGLLGALPLAAFGLVSIAAQPLIARFGVERTTAGALAVLTLATLWRSWPGPNANLWAGTALVGAAIAVGNVAVPVIVKQRFPLRTAFVTSVYVAVLGSFAGLAAALAVPLAAASQLGWRLSLGAWALPTLAGAAYWALHAARAHTRSASSAAAQSAAPSGGAVAVWRTGLAWQLSLYMGVQSSVFYVALTWLPSVEQALGVAPVAAGWHMFVLQVAGVAGNLLAPALMRIDHRMATSAPALVGLAAVAGIALAPALILLWVVLLGLATGVTFVAALSLMALCAGDLATAGKLSAMSQSAGYSIAALILYAAGALQALHTLGPLAVLAASSTGVVLTGLLVGRGRTLQRPRAAP